MVSQANKFLFTLLLCETVAMVSFLFSKYGGFSYWTSDNSAPIDDDPIIFDLELNNYEFGSSLSLAANRRGISFDDSYSSQYILNNPGKCENKLIVVMIVISDPRHGKARSDIRKTWGSASLRRDVAIVFLLGSTNDTAVQRKVVDEDYLYEDIVQADFVDSYRNLTLKSIALLNWANVFCKNAEFVLKVDDDNFVNVRNLLAFFAKNRDAKKTIFGQKVSKCRPRRDPRSKWYLSEEEYPGDVFPDYLIGPAYLITRDSVEQLLNATKVVKMMPVEDVYVTGMCAEQAHVSIVHNHQFVGVLDPIRTDDRGTFNRLITAHSVRSASLLAIWKTVNS